AEQVHSATEPTGFSRRIPGSDGRMQWKRSQIPVEATIDSSGSDDRIQWKRSQIPPEATTACNEAGADSSGSDGRMQRSDGGIQLYQPSAGSLLRSIQARRRPRRSCNTLCAA